MQIHHVDYSDAPKKKNAVSATVRTNIQLSYLLYSMYCCYVSFSVPPPLPETKPLYVGPQFEDFPAPPKTAIRRRAVSNPQKFTHVSLQKKNRQNTQQCLFASTPRRGAPPPPQKKRRMQRFSQ